MDHKLNTSTVTSGYFTSFSSLDDRIAKSNCILQMRNCYYNADMQYFFYNVGKNALFMDVRTMSRLKCIITLY